MLDKAVAAVKADQAVALAMFNKGEGGFKDRDLYPFCYRVSDGKNVAGPVSVPAGTDGRTLKDPTGKAFGQEVFAAAQKPERAPKLETETSQSNTGWGWRQLLGLFREHRHDAQDT